MPNRWKRLRRSLVTDPGRFAGGSAVRDPLGLLAVAAEGLGAPRFAADRRNSARGGGAGPARPARLFRG